MSGEKQTTQSSQNQTQTVAATPEQTQLNQLQLGQAQAFDPTQRQLNQNAGNDINSLLTGSQLPGFLQTLPGGIDENATNTIVNQSLRDVNTQLAKSGAGTMMESGASQAIGARTAADTRSQAAQFNLQNLLQLLNIGVGGQAQVQQPISAVTGQLGTRLAGLNSYSSSGNSSGSTIGMNPFLKSFQSQAGSTMGGSQMKFNWNMGCWVAAEVFNGWDDERTHNARRFILRDAPEWLRYNYLKYGEAIAKFISNKPILKTLIKPLFQWFSEKGKI